LFRLLVVISVGDLFCCEFSFGYVSLVLFGFGFALAVCLVMLFAMLDCLLFCVR